MSPERAKALMARPERACLDAGEFEDMCRTVIREAKLREALEIITTPEMWLENGSGLFEWRGGEDFMDLAAAALGSKGGE